MNYYTREQAIGYLIIAARMLGLNEKEIKDLVYKMEDEMDAWTKETAEQNFDYANQEYIDAAIYELKAANEKFSAMLKEKRGEKNE